MSRLRRVLPGGLEAHIRVVEQEASNCPVTCGAGVSGHIVFGFLGTLLAETTPVEQEVSQAQ